MYYDLEDSSWEGEIKEKARDGYAPIASFGCGTCFRIYKTSSIRLSMDAGCKMFPFNVNLSFVF